MAPGGESRPEATADTLRVAPVPNCCCAAANGCSAHQDERELRSCQQRRARGRDQRWLTPPAAALRAVLCQLQLCLALAGPVVASEGARRDPTAAGAGAGVGPCDITGKAGNPCVAAHSTTRALYAAYDGPLYRVASGKNCHPCVHKGRTCCGPGNSTDIGLLEAGGFADISAQDAACAKGDCVISLVYDQSGHDNHLGQRHMLVNASKHKILIGGKVAVCTYRPLCVLIRSLTEAAAAACHVIRRYVDRSRLWLPRR
jgi:hypothetical protein